MKKRRFLFMMLTALLMSVASYAQGIRGTVVDETGEPVIGATVADKADANGKEDTLEGNLLALLDAGQYLGPFQTSPKGGFISLPFGGVGGRLFFGQLVEVCRIVDESTAIVVVHRLRSKRGDVHGLTADEVLYPAQNERRTTCVVRTIVCRLALIADKL